MAYRRARAAVYRVQTNLYAKSFSPDRNLLPVQTRGQPLTGYMIAVYRARNAAYVERLVREAEETGLRVGLWALDTIVPSLQSVTLGSGQGARSDLLTTLDQRMRESAESFVLVADDDFEFVRGTLASFLQLSVKCGFMLSQPAHIPSSNSSYGFNRCRPWFTARATTFVECGPIFLVHPRFHSRIFPMPEGFGMGWGLELRWFSSLLPTERFGIVDSVWITHHGIIGADYHGFQSEVNRLDHELHGLEISDIRKICKTTSVWRRHRPIPANWALTKGTVG